MATAASDPTRGGKAGAGVSLTEISNTAATLHREHFGRGPGAVKSYAADGIVVCVLSDPFTPAEKTLIEADRGDQVRATRAIHQVAVEATYAEAMAAVVGRPITAHLGAIHIDPDLAIETFTLGPD